MERAEDRRQRVRKLIHASCLKLLRPLSVALCANLLGEIPMLHLDTGNTGFMILCTSLVMLMTPGLAFFYGGLVGRKNVLAIMIQSFVSMGWTTVIWYLYGYSLCFSGDWHGVIGNFHNAFLRGVDLTTAVAE
jgi:ammonium transporter, Amt family